MLKNIGKELVVDSLKSSKTPLFQQCQKNFDGISKAEFSSLIESPQLTEIILKLETVSLQYDVKILTELREAIQNYDRIIWIALGMFFTNLVINFCRIGFFFWDRYCSKEKRHERKLGEAQNQLDLYSELLPSRSVGIRTQDRTQEIE